MASDDILTAARDLTAWFAEKGGCLNPDVEIAHNAASGFYMRAKHRLAAPFDVVTCPLHLSLSVLNIKPDQSWVPCVASPLTLCLENLPLHVLTRLVLIEHLVLEEQSDWYPYISLLPEVDDVVHGLWPEDQDALLENDPLLQARRARRSELKKEWKHALSVMAEVGMARTEIYKECDFNTFLWATGILSSRSFTSANIFPNEPSFPILYPVLDIANHSVTTKARWQCPEVTDSNIFAKAPSFSNQGSASQTAPTTQGSHSTVAFTLRLLDDVQAGDEVFNNYGPKSNAELLLGYGFAIPDNPVDQVPMSVRLPDSLISTFSDEQLPFGLQKSWLQSDGGGLRTRNNLLGRYPSTILFFQGIPPSVVFASYVTALRFRGIDPHDLQPDNIPGQIVLTTLLFMYQTLQEQCSRDPYLLDHTYPSAEDSKNHATYHTSVYLIGQSKIRNSIRRELKSVLEKLRFRMNGEAHFPDGPAIITLRDALEVMSYTNRRAHYDFVGDAPTMTGRPGQTLRGTCSEDYTLWVFFLIASWEATREDNGAETPLSAWMKDLLTLHPYPPSSFDPETTVAGLNLETYSNRFAKLYSDRDSFWASIPKADRESVLALALEVVSSEVFRMPVVVNGQTAVRACMYMRPWQEDQCDERWMFEEAEIPDPELHPLPMVKPLALDEEC